MIDPFVKDAEGDGEWGDVIPDALIAIHSMVLPDGKVLAFGTDGTAGDYDARFVYSLYDPVTDQIKVLPNTTGTNIFCSNMSIDPNTGNVIIMGGDNHNTGDGGTWSGRADVVVFDYRTETIRNLSEEDPAFELHQARWYGTTVNLANGEILMIGGRDENFNGSTIAEIYNHETGLRQLSGVDIADFRDGDGTLTGTYYYAHVWQVSDGSVIMIEAGGTSDNGHDVYRIDVEGEGSYDKIGVLPFPTRNLTSSIMYEPDQVIVASTTGQVWKADLSAAVPVWTPAFTIPDEDGTGIVARTNGTFTMMPDGRVAMIGGSSSAGLLGDSLAAAQKTVLFWDPDTGEISFSAEQDLARMYHSTGLILPTGEIYSAGSGSPGPQENANAQILTPDYLFDENGNQVDDRPEFLSAPSNVDSGSSVRIRLDDTSDISKITFIKSGAATHARNADARYIELDYTVINSNTVEVDIPPANVAIPGLWMMFVVDQDGTPSIANMTGVDMVELQDTGSLGNNPTIVYNIDNEQIDGAFALAVNVRFDSLEFSEEGQTVFELTSETGDMIRLGQVGTSTDMEFVIMQDGVAYRIVAEGAIVENEDAVWRVGVDSDGIMRITKGSEVLAEGQGVVPADVDRVYLVGESGDGVGELYGLVRDLKIANYGNFAELDPNNEESPCATTGEAVCLCNKLVPDVDDTEGNDAAKVFEEYSILDGDVAEMENGARGENDTDLTFTGIIAFADADTTDTHKATLTPQGTNYVGNLTLQAPTTTVEAITGSITWDYVVNDADLDFLEEGEELLQYYDVAIDDGNGAVTTTTLSVTLIGKDDSVPTEEDFIIVQNLNPTSGDDAIVLGDNVRLMNGDYFEGGQNSLIVGNYFELRNGNLDFDNSDGSAYFQTGLRPRLFNNDIYMDEGGITNTLILGNVAEFSLIDMDGNGAGTRNSITIGNSSKSDSNIIIDSFGSFNDWAQIDLNIGNVVEIGGYIDADGYYARRDFDFGYLVTVDGPMYMNGGASTRNDITIGQGFTLNGVWYGSGGIDNIELGRDWDINGPMYLYGGDDTLKLGTTIINDTLTYIFAGAGTDTLLLDVNADDLAAFEQAAQSIGWESLGKNEWNAKSLDLNWNSAYLFDFENVTVNIIGGNDAPIIIDAGTTNTGEVTELEDGHTYENVLTHLTNGTIQFDDVNLGDTHSATIVADGEDYLGEIQYEQPRSAQFGLLPWVFAVEDTALESLEEGEVRVQTYTVTITDQDGESAVETITVTLNGAAETPPPVLSLTAPEAALEGDSGESGVLVFEASIDRPSETDVVADTLVSGGAEPRSLQVVIPAGQTSTDVLVDFEGDVLDEADEVITVQLVNLVGADAGSVTASTTILDDDLPPPTLSLEAEATLFEGNAGEVGTIEVIASLDQAYDRIVSAKVQIEGSASGPESISLLPGQTSVAFELTFDGNDVDNPDQAVTVTLTEIENALAGEIEALTIILDDDLPPPTLSLEAESTVFEGNSGDVGTIQVTARLDQAYDQTVTASVVIDGAATGPASITLLPGQTAVSFDLTFAGNNLDNPDQEVTVALIKIENAIPGQVEASTIILDDDLPPPVISLTSAGDVQEGDAGEKGVLVFTATLDRAHDVDVTATVDVLGAATGPSVITIPAGAIDVDFEVSFPGDDAVESDETVVVQISDIANATPGTIQASAVIRDDDEVLTPVLEIDSVASFAGRQDRGNAEISEDGAAVQLTGNAWKALFTDITVTENTVISFDFEASDTGEVSGLLFETNNYITNSRGFQIGGTQNWERWGANTDYRTYEDGSGMTSIEIRVGDVFTGRFDRLVFVGDDDKDASTNATFSNIRIYEDDGLAEVAAFVDEFAF